MSNGSEKATCSSALKTAQDDDSSSSDRSSSSEERIPKKKRMKRKASLRTRTLIKMTWLAEAKRRKAAKLADKSASTSAVTDDDTSSSDRSSSSEERFPKKRRRRDPSLRKNALFKAYRQTEAQSRIATKLADMSASTSAVAESCNTSVKVVGKRGNKRKIAAAEGGPMMKRQRLDTEDRDDQETNKQNDNTSSSDLVSASTSAVSESCNTSVKVVGKRGNKRKIAAAEGGPTKRR